MRSTHDYTIATSDLTRRFGRLTAVDGLALHVERGSVYAFLGPNGAGKTTTIRMLLGLIRPHAGEVRLFSRRLRNGRIPLLRRVGALVESPSLYPHLTGRENLEVTRRLAGWPRERVGQALRTVGLEQAARRRVGGYSTGMRQRLALALALLGEPDLLILDEPTNGLDPAGIREIRDLIRRLPEERGVTVFLSSHLLGEVEQVATHVGVIRGGRLVFEGPPDGLRARTEERVAVDVDRPEEALALLAQGGWMSAHRGARRLSVAVDDPGDVGLINGRLVGAGLTVTHLALERPSLEDVFIHLTDDTEEVTR